MRVVGVRYRGPVLYPLYIRVEGLDSDMISIRSSLDHDVGVIRLTLMILFSPIIFLPTGCGSSALGRLRTIYLLSSVLFDQCQSQSMGRVTVFCPVNIGIYYWHRVSLDISVLHRSPAALQGFSSNSNIFNIIFTTGTSRRRLALL